jgi:hypothetical protein
MRGFKNLVDNLWINFDGFPSTGWSLIVDGESGNS